MGLLGCQWLYTVPAIPAAGSKVTTEDIITLLSVLTVLVEAVHEPLKHKISKQITMATTILNHTSHRVLDVSLPKQMALWSTASVTLLKRQIIRGLKFIKFFPQLPLLSRHWFTYSRFNFQRSWSYCFSCRQFLEWRPWIILSLWMTVIFRFYMDQARFPGGPSTASTHIKEHCTGPYPGTRL